MPKSKVESNLDKAEERLKKANKGLNQAGKNGCGCIFFFIGLLFLYLLFNLIG